MPGHASIRPPLGSAAPALAADGRLRLAARLGALAPLVYVTTDVVAAAVYRGYRYADQAVSELFAIGAPTSAGVVAGFTISSVMTLAFGVAMWRDSDGQRALRLLGAMLVCSAVVGLLLWNLAPMHMRGEATSATDTAHLVLATNPFTLVALGAAVAAFPGRFRTWTLATIALILALASYGFSLAPELQAGAPTPWLGLAERIAQYAHGAWQAGLAFAWWRERQGEDGAALKRATAAAWASQVGRGAT